MDVSLPLFIYYIGLTLAGITPHYAYLTWDQDDIAIGYNVYRAYDSCDNDFTMIAGFVKDTSYRDFAVQRTKSYCYEVTAIDQNGEESGPSNQVLVTIPSGRKPKSSSASHGKN